uniref:Uncharacterized protein n=1 Tax=Ditylenchus dipsaci TaxID=166011 RepID=A0A915DX62_9BILA
MTRTPSRSKEKFRDAIFAKQTSWNRLNKQVKPKRLRVARSTETRRKDVPKNIANLHKLQRYMSMAQEYNNYMQKIVQRNYRYLKTVSPLTNSKFELHDDSMGSVEQWALKCRIFCKLLELIQENFPFSRPKFFQYLVLKVEIGTKDQDCFLLNFLASTTTPAFSLCLKY